MNIVRCAWVRVVSTSKPGMGMLDAAISPDNHGSDRVIAGMMVLRSRLIRSYYPDSSITDHFGATTAL